MTQFIKYGDNSYININNIDRITYDCDASGWYIYLYYDGQKKRYRSSKSCTKLEVQAIFSHLMADIEDKMTVISVYGGIQEDTDYHGN